MSISDELEDLANRLQPPDGAWGTSWRALKRDPRPYDRAMDDLCAEYTEEELKRLGAVLMPESTWSEEDRQLIDGFLAAYRVRLQALGLVPGPSARGH